MSKIIDMFQRSPLDETKWIVRYNDLIELAKTERPKLTNLFQDLDWLKKKGAQFREPSTRELDSAYPFDRVAVMIPDYLYVGCKEHYVLIPTNRQDPLMTRNIALIAEYITSNENWREYILLKKRQGSIDYPHWHLLRY